MGATVQIGVFVEHKFTRDQLVFALKRLEAFALDCYDNGMGELSQDAMEFIESSAQIMGEQDREEREYEAAKKDIHEDRKPKFFPTTPYFHNEPPGGSPEMHRTMDLRNDIGRIIRRLENNEDVRHLIQVLGNYLTDAYDAGGDPAHKEAVAHLMCAWSALEKVSGR